MPYDLAEMIRAAREHNRGHWRLPFPQDVKLWLAAGTHLRISFASLVTDASGMPRFDKAPRFTFFPRHYVPPEEDSEYGIGGYVRCQGERCPWCDSKDQIVKKLRPCHATVVVGWPTKADGTIDRDLWGQFEFQVMPWVYTGTKHERLQEVHREHPLNRFDLLLTCEDTHYQRFLLTPCKESLLARIFETANNHKLFEERGQPEKISQWQGWYSAIIHRANQIHPRLPFVMARESLDEPLVRCRDRSPERALESLISIEV